MENHKFIFLLIFFTCLPFYFFSLAKSATAASLSFSPASKDVGTGESFTVNVVLDTQGEQSDGADVIVLYDSAKLSVTSATLGDLYTNKVVEDKSTTGKIIFRATTTATNAFSGSGILATIGFKAIADGKANVSFDFTSGSTTDSNIAKEGTDLLTMATGATYTVGEGGVGGTTASPTPSTSTTTTPVAGVVSPTIILATLGFLLLLVPLLI